MFPGAEVPSNPVLLCPAKHANRQQPLTFMSRSPGRKAPALSLSKTQNVAKLTSQSSSSRRMLSWLSLALGVIVSNDGVAVAMDAPLASDNDNPATPRTGTALLRRFRLEVRDTKILRRLTARLTPGMSALAPLLGAKQTSHHKQLVTSKKAYAEAALMSASLIGRSGSSTSDCPPLQFRCRSRARASLRTRHQALPYWVSKTRWNNLLGRPCQTNGRFKHTYEFTHPRLGRQSSCLLPPNMRGWN